MNRINVNVLRYREVNTGIRSRVARIGEVNLGRGFVGDGSADWEPVGIPLLAHCCIDYGLEGGAAGAESVSFSRCRWKEGKAREGARRADRAEKAGPTHFVGATTAYRVPPPAMAVAGLRSQPGDSTGRTPRQSAGRRERTACGRAKHRQRRWRLRMSVAGIKDGRPCYCSMAYIATLTLCRIVANCQVS